MGVAGPSQWARDRFGGIAEELQRVIPQAIEEAHGYALAAQLSSGRRTHEPYGATLMVSQFEELVEATRDLPGVVARRPAASGARFECVVVQGTAVVLYPLRYAKDDSSHEDARLRTPVSDLRKALLTLTPPVLETQLTIDQAGLEPMELEAQLAEEAELLEQLAALGQVVIIGYASHPDRGVINLGWGSAELLDEDSGSLTWHHWEPLPLAHAAAGRGGGRPLAPMRPLVPTQPPGSPSAGRFDDAPLDDDLDLTLRSPLAGPPSSEEEAAPPKTGSDDDSDDDGEAR